MFFTFEGGEGVGKTTLISSLQMALVAKGYKVLVTREPGGTCLGKKIRALLLEDQQEPISKKVELFLFLADRSHHVQTLIQPFLENGGLVLCDRYFDSSFAYQSGSFPLEKLIELNTYATDSLFPDKTFYLDLDPHLGFERIKRSRMSSLDRMEQKDFSFHQKVRQEFLNLVELFPNRISKIDASKEAKEVFDEVFKIILSKLT